MVGKGKVEEYLLRKMQHEGAIHITLIDPEKEDSESASYFAKEVEARQTSAIMLGGSTLVSSTHLDNVVRAVKKAVHVPVILFPNNVTGISRYADAIWFMSLLNSSDPYFIAGAQVLGAPLIKEYGLEPIPLGYIIAGEGGSVGVIGRAFPIPYDKPELASAYALAAQYFGMRYIYLEAGSGAKQPIPCEMVRMVKKVIDIPLVVGGGIGTAEQASEIVFAGADIVVTSTILEKSGKGDMGGRLAEIMKGIKEGATRKTSNRQAEG